MIEKKHRPYFTFTELTLTMQDIRYCMDLNKNDPYNPLRNKILKQLRILQMKADEGLITGVLCNERQTVEDKLGFSAITNTPHILTQSEEEEAEMWQKKLIEEFSQIKPIEGNNPNE